MVGITKKNAVSRTALNVTGGINGGGGGNRTRVRKSSTASSTYLAMLFNFTWHPPTGGLMTGELPIV